MTHIPSCTLEVYDGESDHSGHQLRKGGHLGLFSTALIFSATTKYPVAVG